MPMLPSAAAAAVYGAIKVAGYGVYAAGLAKYGRSRVHPLVFGVAKTLLGLAAGIAFFSILAAYLPPQTSDLLAWLVAIPIRLAVWLLALHLFFRFGQGWRVWLVAAVLGTVLSYALDGVMWLLYRVLPGMQMPWC